MVFVISAFALEHNINILLLQNYPDIKFALRVSHFHLNVLKTITNVLKACTRI